MLVLLLLVPLIVIGYMRWQDRRRLTARQLGPLGLIQAGPQRPLGRRRHAPPAFFLIALTLLFFGLARPELPVSLPRVEGSVVLAFDVSSSMTADDLEPTRLAAAKEAAVTFVDNQPATINIGVVAFGSGGLVVQEPTADRQAVLAAIERLSPEGGTSLGQGIFTALNAVAGQPLVLDDDLSLQGAAQKLDVEPYSSAVIMLLTDGENTAAPDPLDIAQLAAEAGVRLYPVGVGSQEGAVLDMDGFQIVSRLDETILREMASITNGRYYRAEDAAALQEIYRDVDLQLTIQGEKMEITGILAGVSALFLLIGGALSMFWFGRIP